MRWLDESERAVMTGKDLSRRNSSGAAAAPNGDDRTVLCEVDARAGMRRVWEAWRASTSGNGGTSTSRTRWY